VKKFKVSAVLILFLLSVVGGQYLLYKTYRFHLRNQAKQSLRELATEDAELLAFSKNDFLHGLPFTRVVDKDDEIILQGEFFDVKNIAVTEDSVFMYAYRDSNEKHLVAQFEKSARENDHSPAAMLLQQFTSFFIFIPLNQTQLTFLPSFHELIFISDNNFYHLKGTACDSPPPRLV